MRAKVKGDNFERQVAAILGDYLGVDCKRALLSGPRGEGDVEGIPTVHIECKRREQTRLGAWYAKEALKTGGKPLVIIHKRSREPIFVSMEINDWITLFRDALADK
jgi:Holliday junction resolvase